MRSPAQTWARLIGWTLVLAGILGFFYSSSFGSPGETDAVLGILDVNGFHNLVHLLSGLLGISMSRSFSAARLYCILLAVAYATVAIWGFAIGAGDAILSIVPVNDEDNFLHAFIALVSLIVGLGQPPVPAPSTAEPGPGFRYN
jgi:multidrug transporter EmrE-like cation transporter